MYGKFVGLDLGSHSIKLVLIRRGLRSLEILQTVALDNRIHEESGLLHRIFIENSLPQNDVSVSINSDPISIKVLDFPFNDPRKIDQVYEFELENVSTFDPYEKIHGYHLVRLESRAEALVCMFERDDIRNLIEVCKQEIIDPKVVTYPPCAYGALDRYLLQDRPILLIDIGASRISFSLFDEDGLRRVRTSSRAGNSIVEGISRSKGVSIDEAESLMTGGVRDDNRELIEEAYSSILTEIKKTIKFFEMDLKEDIRTVLLAGGISMLNGFPDYLQRQLQKDVRGIYIPELGERNSPRFALAFALALYGIGIRKGVLNFRKGEFQYTGSDEELRRKIFIPAILTSLIILVSLYRYGSNYFELKGRVKQIESTIEAEVNEMFPDIKVIPKPVAFMESEVKKVNDEINLIQNTIGKNSQLDALKDISVSIPSDINLSIDEISFEDDKTVKLIGRCGSYQEVADIEKAFSESGLFEKVNRDSTNPAVNNSIKFQVSLLLK